MATTPKIADKIAQRIKDADEVLERCRRLRVDPVELLKAAVQQRESQHNDRRK